MMRHFDKTSGGQGLLEVVIVMVLFTAALAAAVPAYLGIQGHKADKAAKAHLYAAVPMAQAYRMRHHGTYARMDAADLLTIDPRVSPTLTVAWARKHQYCLTETVHGKTWSLRGPYTGSPPYSAGGTCG
jgi:type II secretory pathway pseudopilin PulG